MFRWHEPTCSKPFINVVGGLPWCETCCAVPPMDEDLDFRDDLDPPPPPSRENGQPRTLAWPAIVKYDEDDAEKKDEHLPIDDNDADLPLCNASADDSQAPLNATKTARHKSFYPFLPSRSIRILDITPGGPDDILHGNFRVVQLSIERPHYEALSYTWADAAGNSQRCRAMYIGPFWDVVPITQNCEHALRSVRPRNDRLMQRTLWIDSVCVNQNDVVERTTQVALMPEIYSSAAEVLVYLGPATESTNIALQAVSRSLRTNDCSHSHGEICKGCQDSIRALFKLPYFGRLWVVQEILLSRSITMFCGEASSPLPFSDISGLVPPDSWTIRRMKKPLNHKFELLSLMVETGNCACKDPRDKVFALLGILSARRGAPFLADYGLSLDEVSIGIVSYFIQVCNLGRLVFMLAGIQHKEAKRLPSWVPDIETSFKLTDGRKNLFDRLMERPYISFRELGPFGREEVGFRGKRKMERTPGDFTQASGFKPLIFEPSAKKRSNVTSRYARLKLSASKLCNVRQVFDVRQAIAIPDLQAVESLSTWPKVESPYAAPLLIISKSENSPSFREHWSDFMMETDELYWLHDAECYAILRPDPSCNTHSLVSTCHLMMSCWSGTGPYLNHMYMLRWTQPDENRAVRRVRTTLEAIVPPPKHPEAELTLLESNDEVAIMELAIRLTALLPGLEGYLWNQWLDCKLKWLSNLATSDFLGHAISDLECSVHAVSTVGEGIQSDSKTASSMIHHPRAVAAALWSILPQRIEILSSQTRKTKRRIWELGAYSNYDEDAPSVYRNLEKWANINNRLVSGIESGEFDNRSVEYYELLDEFKRPHHSGRFSSRWRSSWDNFRRNTGFDESFWDSHSGIVHVLKLYQGYGTMWRPLTPSPSGKTAKLLEKTETCNWKYLEDRHTFRDRIMNMSPETSWIFRSDQQQSHLENQLAIRLHMQMCGLSWTSMSEVTIK